MTSRTARQVIAQRREWQFRVRLVWGRVVVQSAAQIGLAKVRPPIFIVFLATQLEERDGLPLLTVRIGLQMNIRGFVATISFPARRVTPSVSRLCAVYLQAPI